MKQLQFTQLAQDVSNCHLCANMITPPHFTRPEYLENDDHGLHTDTPYVNRWNLWQGDLDADIMVIGQDYGQKEEGSNLVLWKTGTYTNPTDVGLRTLFREAFSIDIDAGDTPLFFTNMANCYRKQRTSGGMHAGWLPICANRYMARLIRIVRPKVIIVLGLAAFEAMYCMDGIQVRCENPVNAAPGTLAEIMKYDYRIDLNGCEIGVFPVYHPGANSKRNRSMEQQVEDWKRIKGYYDGVK